MAFEFTNGASKPNTLILIGGLSDGLGTIGFTKSLVESLEQSSWSLLSPILSSSYSGWGVGSLDQDVEEITKCVEYIQARKQGGKVVIMGHSTGSQDVLHYLYSNTGDDASLRPAVDGAILQAAVSDREAMQATIEGDSDEEKPEGLQEIYIQLVKLARETVSAEEDGDDKLLPLSMTSALGYGDDTPVSARRFLSLVSPDSPGQPAEDDLFSSDLSDDSLKKTFGVVGSSGRLREQGTLLVLLSEEDDAYPDNVDPDDLIEKWQRITDEGHQHRVWNQEFSGVVAGATHDLREENQEEPQRELARRVTGYLATL
jgi:hypothetical protein